MDKLIVEKDGKWYSCLWISLLMAKCGNCIWGIVSPYYEKKTICRVCGAKIVYENKKT